MPSRVMNWNSFRGIVIVVFIAVASFLGVFFASSGVLPFINLRTQEEAIYFETSEKLLREVTQKTADIRGFPTPPDLKLEVHNRDWARENFGIRYVEAFSDEIAFQQAAYEALFLIPANTSLAEIRVEQAGWTIASAYGDRVYVIRDFFSPDDRSSSARTMAHEITHILQARNLPGLNPRFFDEKRAWATLIEGDADVTSDEFARQEGLSPRPGVPRASTSGLLDPNVDPLTQLFFFPYRFGPDFVEEVFETGGWVAVNELYRRPPSSTEQLLHPEKYFASETPRPVALELTLSSNWQLVRSDTMGEHVVLVLLGSRIQAESAIAAAAGWGGDNMTLFRNENSTLLAWRIAWDTREDAGEFFEAFKIHLKTLGAEEVAPSVWRIGNQYFLVKLDSDETLLVSSTELRVLDSSRTSDELVLFRQK